MLVTASASALGETAMSKAIAAISITAVATATLIASVAVFLTSVVPEASATQVVGSPEQFLVKSDRLPNRVTGAACSSRSWPNYDRNCLFDLRQPNDQRTVRVIILRR